MLFSGRLILKRYPFHALQILLTLPESSRISRECVMTCLLR